MRLVKSREPRVKSRRRSFALRTGSGSRLSTLDPRRPARRGITLVELLVTILILAILGALILGVAAIAAETAREARTRNMIARLHTLLMEHMDTYKTRRVKLNPDVEQRISSLTGAARGRALAEARLYALREMMLMEVPDRWSDVLLNPVSSTPTINDARPVPIYLRQRTDLSNVYLRRYQGLVGRTNTLTGQPNTRDDIRANEGAECLYMIITLATGDGEARSLFGESVIGDTDGDGAPEFLDGWGRPIDFIRWAPGFQSEIQLSANELGGNPTSQAWHSAADRDHDPYDVFRIERAAFRLVPLIYSAGRDETYGIVVGPDRDQYPDYIPWPKQTGPIVPYFGEPPLTPYQRDSSLEQYIGSVATDNAGRPLPYATDNIHNHLIGER